MIYIYICIIYFINILYNYDMIWYGMIWYDMLIYIIVVIWFIWSIVVTVWTYHHIMIYNWRLQTSIWYLGSCGEQNTSLPGDCSYIYTTYETSSSSSSSSFFASSFFITSVAVASQELEQQLQILALALDEAEISKETQDDLGDHTLW